MQEFQVPIQTKRTLDSPAHNSKAPKISKSQEEEDEGEEEAEYCREKMTENPRVQRYLVALEYIGTRFSGSQKQPNCRTVMGALEEAFHKFIGQPVSIAFSSRTDAGVHALSNVCHVDVERISKRKPNELLPPHEPGVVKRAVNHFLQKDGGDMMVIDVRFVPPDFHARFMAQERTYFYRLLSSPEPLSTFEKERAWHVPEDLDIHAMGAACGVLVGHHDFSSFRAAGCQAKSPVKTLDELHVSEVLPSPNFPTAFERTHNNTIEETNASKRDAADEEDLNGSRKCRQFGQRRTHQCYVITARARSFLYHQVRLLVGVLKAVGSGVLTVADVKCILEAKDVTAASPMAPASGLYLGIVKYNFDSDAER
ncbi:uncharacterized protein LOC18448433 isoform X1 [Amborella trichopoda]|uniref:tRNA pseudouridine synthase n=1 Tax=Amborella trichopoda TaxID=13333 RepID=U5DHQ0_AMBTC|nr:uncharacterized protein LOC18448433 isoform X1 [Amborella trichopoda]ERN20023.1 hypothetical protein AMTR_s00071p00170380 [Amborella trichopoda]|eukprot:XP_006858556.1 uncharacterized protein LOC18448433 isoform X1 [Amborella trichopoda]